MPDIHSVKMPRDPQDPPAVGARELFVAHARFVGGFLAKLGIDLPERDDLVQEVFLVAHRHGGFVPGEGRPSTWLAHIAVRVASNARRSTRRRRENHDDEALEQCAALGAGPHENLEAAESLDRVERALGTLDLDHRAVFLLFEIEGDSCEQIARGLGIPVGTVYSRLHKARKSFQRAYERLVRSPRVAVPLGQAQGALR